MKLYSGPLSLFSAKTRIALAEKELPHELIQVGWSRADRYLPHHPEVARLNPKKQVPVLLDGDVAVYDSTLIAEYLEERYPAPPLFPAALAERVRCRRQEAAADERWFPCVWDLIETRFYPHPGDAAAEQRAAAAERALGDLYAELDCELGDREYYCGDFTVADIATGVFASAASTLGAPPPARLRNVAAWMDRLSRRDSVAGVMADLQAAAASALAA